MRNLMNCLFFQEKNCFLLNPKCTKTAIGVLQEEIAYSLSYKFFHSIGSVNAAYFKKQNEKVSKIFCFAVD